MDSKELLEVEVHGLAAGGKGVGRTASGLVCFVSGALPGDRVLARVERSRSRHLELVPTRILRAAPSRREPPCPLQPRCGGCPWMTLEEHEQRQWKRRLVQEALARIGGVHDVEVEAILAGESTLGYRNKVEFSLGLDADGRRALGLHGSAPGHEIVDVGRCLLQSETANNVLASIRAFLLDPELPRSFFRQQDPLRLVIRSSRLSGEILVALRDTGDASLPRLRELAHQLRAAHREISGVVLLISRPGRRGGVRTEALSGRDWIEESLAGMTFQLPAASFLQVNLEAAELLVQCSLTLVGPVAGVHVLDLYGGVGIHALALARQGARVTLCEADAAAVAAGRQSAILSGLRAVRFVRADVLHFLRSQQLDTADVGLVVANPPRTGLGPGVAPAMAGLRPERIVLISCDAPTLARDVKRLSQGGFTLQRVIPVDMFPQTAQVETVSVLARS